MAKARWMSMAAGALLAVGAGAAQAHEVRPMHAPGRPVGVAPQGPLRTWVPGHWEVHGVSQVWVPGRWVVVRGHAVPRHGWHGHAGRTARWDQDGDGVANRRDRDRDGDGVPNWRDHAPANPRWR